MLFGRIILFAAASALVLLNQSAAQGRDAALDPAARSVISTLGFLLAGVGAFIAAMGLALRQSGLAEPRNRAAMPIEAAGVAAVALIVFICVGFNLAFNIEAGGLLGSILPPPLADDVASADANVRLFQHAGLAALAAVIPAMAVAERVRLWPLLAFTLVFAGLIYPIGASWVWGGGYLAATWSFADVGGGAVVHVAAGAAGLAACLILGVRKQRKQTETDLTGLPMAALGVSAATFGVGAALVGLGTTLQTPEDAGLLARIVVNIAVAAAAGVAVTLTLTQTIYRRIDAAAVLNASVGALAAMSASPATPALWQAGLIGGIAGVLVTLGGPALDRAGVSDPVGVAPTHLFCGAFGVLILPWHQEGATVLGQIAGLVMIAAFACSTSALALITLRYTFGLRTILETDQAGLDRTYLTTAAHREAGLTRPPSVNTR